MVLSITTANNTHSAHDIIVYGISTRALSIARSIWTSLQTIPGGRITDLETKYHELIKEATSDMIAKAKEHGGHKIISIKYDIAELSRGQGNGFLICYCYGTSIKDASAGGKRSGKRKKHTTKKSKMKRKK